jgi:hypothetical protein
MNATTFIEAMSAYHDRCTPDSCRLAAPLKSPESGHKRKFSGYIGRVLERPKAALQIHAVRPEGTLICLKNGRLDRAAPAPSFLACLF